ncbi:calcium-binding protein [Pseudomonas indica]|nr:calcium-binding protein [Pseudomonas indica]
MIANGENVRVINTTEAAAFLESQQFKNAVANAFGVLVRDLDERGTPANDFLFASKNGAWSNTSERFVKAAVGAVRVLAPFAPENRVFAQAELPTLLDNPNVTNVDGFPRAELVEMRDKLGLAQVKNFISANSLQQVFFSGLSSGNVAGYLELTPESVAKQLEDPAKFGAWIEHLQSLSPEQRASFELGAGVWREPKLNIGSRILNKLPLFGALLGFTLAALQASEAEAAGNSERAREIMELWAFDAAGSEVGAAIGTLVGGIVVGVLGAAGAALSAPVMGAIVLGSTLIGAIFGGAGGTELYELLHDRDANERMDVIDKLSNLIFGATYTISSPLPPDLLAGNRLSLDATLGRDEIVANAKNDIAWRYALRELNPFVVTGIDYSRHNTDGTLDLYDPAAGEGGMTEQYLQDRAAMLTWKIAYDNGYLDEDDAPHEGPKPYTDSWDSSEWEGNWDFVDYSHRLPGGSPLTLTIDGSGLSLSDHQVVFGGKEADVVEGGDLSDHLYGMAGNDVITAEGGEDYLEGGLGDDQLDGGEDNDTLLGGSGDDLLIGGSGNDSLEGGVGNDLYKFAAGSGYDIVQDADGQGRIEVDGVTLGGGEKIAEGVYREAATGWTFTRVDNDLLITNANRTDAIRVANWSSARNLGITLAGEASEPVIETPITGDFIKQRDGSQYVTSATGYASAGPQADTADVLLGASGADSIVAGGGNDALSGEGGDDWLDGGAGNDLILGGLGADRIKGGDGDDFIFAGATGSISRPSSPDDPLPSFQGTEYSRGFSWVAYLSAAENALRFAGVNNLRALAGDDGNVVEGGLGNDRIHAGSASDVVHGGGDDDVIYGLGGSDTLLGDAGNDFIRGDGNTRSALYLEHTAIEQHGNDLIHGGQGEDSLVGDGGSDLLYGGDDNDMLYGDRMSDGTPDETPFAYMGNDTLDGGEGDDYLEGGGRADNLLGGGGNDTLWGDADAELLDASVHGDDTLDGGQGDDVLGGGGGSDLLYGGDGADELIGDERGGSLDASAHGDDTLEGGAGTDTLWGGGGHDVLRGGDGNDWLAGEHETGPDAVSTLTGDDLLEGGAGNDTLLGGNGNDTLLGGGDDDLLYGGAGDDVLEGGMGVDHFEGGLGDDRYRLSASDVEANSLETIEDSGGFNTLAISGAVSAGAQGTNGDLRLSLGRPDERREVLIRNGFRGSIQQLDLGGGQTVSLQEWLQTNLTQSLNLTAQAGETVLGGGGADTLTAAKSGATLVAGRGNDTLNMAGSGVSGVVAEFSLGDGMDNVVGGVRLDTLSTRQANVARFGEGVDKSSVRLVATRGTDSAANLYVAYGSQGDRIQVTFSGSGTALLRPFDRFEFSDGSALTWEQLVAGGVQYDATTPSGVEAIGTLANDHVQGGEGSDTVRAGAGDDLLEGGAGDDVLWGDAGADTLVGGAGDDYLRGGDGNDLYRFGRGFGQDTLDNYDPSAGRRDMIEFTDGLLPEDLQVSRSGNDLWLTLKETGDRLTVLGYFANDGSGMSAVGAIRFANGTEWDIQQVKAMVLAGTSGADSLVGYATGDVLSGGEGSDRIWGKAGADTLDGGSGDDYLSGGTGNDVYRFGRGYGQDTIESEDDTTDKTDVLVFADGISPDDVIVSRSSDHVVLSISGTQDAMTVLDYFREDGQSSARIELIRFADGTEWSVDQVKAKAIQGTAGDDRLYGYASSDWLKAGEGNDSLYGNDGNDTLEGGKGNDYLEGGYGNDTYRFDPGFGEDTINNRDDASERTDSIELNGVSARDIKVSRSGSDLYLRAAGDTDSIKVMNYFANNGAGPSHIDSIRFEDGTIWTVEHVKALALQGSDAGDTLYGYDSNDLIEGAAGYDYLYGGDGNDTLLGGEHDDYLLGEAGDDVLRGGVGDDVLFGGDGNDTYVYAAGDGQDVINGSQNPDSQSSLHFEGDIQPENIRVARSGNSLYVSLISDTGWVKGQVEIKNYFTASEQALPVDKITFENDVEWDHAAIRDWAFRTSPGNDYVVGFESADYLSGMAGNDTLNGMGGDDDIHGGEGNDALSGDKGNDSLYGDAGNDWLSGNEGNDLLQGGRGNDTLYGGSGSDVYVHELGDGDDTISESPRSGDVNILRYGEGTAVSDLSFYRVGPSLVIYNGKDSSQLTVEFFFSENAIGFLEFAGDPESRVSADYIRENADYGVANTMTGTSADDVFNVDNSQDQVIEQAGGGIDTVIASRNYTLPSNVENLTLTGVLDLRATGNELDNILVGNDGDNVIIGGKGNDTASGGKGDDKYYGVEKVIELEREGVDTIYDIYGGTLPDNVENFSLNDGTGTYSWDTVAVIGNDLDNTLYSNKKRGNHLIGGRGADTMIAAGSSAVFYVDNPGDVVIAAKDDIYDQVVSDIDYTLGDYAENLKLRGAAVFGGGNELNNELDGTESQVANVFRGGAGNDLYKLGAGDVAIENVDEGFDTIVIMPVEGATYSLLDYPNIEGLRLDGYYVGGATVLGNELDNQLFSNTLGNRLEGGAGNDTLVGGNGDDTLAGDSGNDSLSGGAGSDTYLFGIGSGEDVIADGAVGGIDTLLFADGVDADQLWFARNGDNLEVSIIGSNDKVTIHSWFWGRDYHVEQFKTSDGKTLQHSQVQTLVDAMAAFDVPSGEGKVVPQDVKDTLKPILTEAWELPIDTTNSQTGSTNTGTQPESNGNTPMPPSTNTLTGSDNAEELRGTAADDRIDGLAGNDILRGEDGNDLLNGGAGADTLHGGNGNDLLNGGDARDVLYGGAGNDTLRGGADIDYLKGDAGSDTYLFAAGDGSDLINNADTDPNSIDTARFEDARFDDLWFSRSGDDLYITVAGTSDRAIVSKWYADANNQLDRIEAGSAVLLNEQVEALVSAMSAFGVPSGAGKVIPQDVKDTLKPILTEAWNVQADDTSSQTENGDTDTQTENNNGTPAATPTLNTLTGSDNAEELRGSADDDRIDGLGGADTLHGGNGNDLLNGGDARDVLYGGTGNDTLRGGADIDYLKGDAGSDTYLFAAGDGSDLINNYDTDPNSIDTARFEDAAYDQLWFSRSGDDLYISVTGSRDRVIVSKWYTDANNQLDRIEAGSSALLNNQVDSLVSAMAAFAVPAAGAIIPQEVREQMAPVLAASWQ